MQKIKLLIGFLVIVAIIGGIYIVVHKSASTAETIPSPSSTTTSTSVVQTKTASGVGQYLADSSGNALYTYGADSSGVSNCSGSCLYSWPVYSASNAPSTLSANVTVITRSDNSKQYAYKGMPLYTFSGDSVGQVTGDNVSNFHIAKP